MHRTWIFIASLTALIGVVLGAFGAHALKGRLEPAMLQSFEVGVRYQLYHALALLAVAWIMSMARTRLAQASAVCMLAGVFLFSGSIYGLALGGWKWLGPVTPIGGVTLMVGWLLLALAGLRLPR
jgi:uncharacterized membrane protein YgdD (TMEM256/DUF423 family)